MMNENDKVIDSLLKDVDDKISGLKCSKFMPKTTGILELYGVKYNLHSMNDLNSLNFLLASVNTLAHSCNELSISVELSGYDVFVWLDDIRQKIKCVSDKDRMKVLNSAKTQLDGLLSDDAKVTKMIESIRGMLND